MSLTLYLSRFKIVSLEGDKYVTVEFRGKAKSTAVLNDTNEIVEINKVYRWTMRRPVEMGETLILQLLSRNRRFTSARVLGVYTLGLHIVVMDGELAVTDSLVDSRNRSVPAFVEMQLYYTPPVPSLIYAPRPRAIEPGPSSQPSCSGLGSPRPSTSTSAGGSGQSHQPHSPPRITLVQDSDDDTDEEDALENIRRNIEAIEDSMNKRHSEPDLVVVVGEESRADKIKNAGRKFLRRGFSFGSSSEEKVISPVMDPPRKHSTLRSFMSFGRHRTETGEDEARLLSSSPDKAFEMRPSTSHDSFSSDECQVEELPYLPVGTLIRTANEPQIPKRRSAAVIPNAHHGLKAADFQICVRVIEARQLTGLNMDPVVCVQVGDQRKYTSVKESTNCPYYNEYFVFDFHTPPEVLLDKMITLSVQHSRSLLRANKLLGNFKLDVATLWSQPNRQFYHKWALLTDPEDVSAGVKGYLKVDISVIGKGDAIKIPPKSEKDEDDIEANLLLPDGVPLERQRARFVIRIYRADGLPKMNYSILANMKRAFTGESPDLVNPYVEVTFAGMTGSTTVKKRCYTPVWNEQLVFTEMFPPLCQRIKVQLRDDDPVHPNVIGTHFIDLKNISNDGERGFLPTFGPAYVYMYGSSRSYSLVDQHTGLNNGIGEGVAYRARLLMSIRTEIIEAIEYPFSGVDLEAAPPVPEGSSAKNQEFFLFTTIFDATMVDHKLVGKHIYFEISIGNAGNTLDGNRESLNRTQDLDMDLENVSADVGYWQSTTVPVRAVAIDKLYYHLPYWENKPCMHVRSVWPDHRQRMYNSNVIASIIDKLEDGLAETQMALEANNDARAVTVLKEAMEETKADCAKYASTTTPPLGPTKLDKERQKMCLREIEQIGVQARHLKALITKCSVKDRLRTAYTYLNTLKHLCDDPQPSMPDVFIWLVSNGKRLAYQRIPVRDIIYSANQLEAGKNCGRTQIVVLKWPGKKASTPGGWSIPAQLNCYMWLGALPDKGKFAAGLPVGYEIHPELRLVQNLRSNAPASIYYSEKHNFQLRAYIYQARSLIGSDSSGLSDPFAKVIIGEHCASTQVIDETLSPTWDELLIIDNVLLYSSMAHIKSEPPTIVVEIFDQDQVGKSEFIGRTFAKPHVKGVEEVFDNEMNSLEWHEVSRGADRAGELLAMFELLEVPPGVDRSVLPELPEPRARRSDAEGDKGPVLPVPRGIRPTLSKYRIEVLFWGLRDLKRVHFMNVDKPRVDIDCAGHIIYSTIIQNAKRNPNFPNPVKFIDVELPDQDLYRPPLTIRVIDCRSFGRVTLVGTHTINSINEYVYIPMTKKEREAEERKKSLIQLQNVDLRAKCIRADPHFTIENEGENCPLLSRRSPHSSPYRLGSKAIVSKKAKNKKRKQSVESVMSTDDGSKDWWTKYIASVEVMIDNEKKAKTERQELSSSQVPSTSQAVVEYEPQAHSSREDPMSPSFERRRNRHTPLSPKVESTNINMTKKNEIPASALTKIYPHELEANPEFGEFKDWLQSFELYRGKKTSDDTEDENRVVGVFKGALKIYKYPLPKGVDEFVGTGCDPNLGVFQHFPTNEPIRVLVRVYIVKATDLHPMDLNGRADPYVVLQTGCKKISDKEHYISKQLNPVFGKCFEIEATFPQDSMLTIQVLDWDLVGADDLIGETKIDLENRFYSRHRATCGLPTKYEEQGYNRWRDAMKPTQILAKLCKEGRLEAPEYEPTRVVIGRTVFTMPVEDRELFSDLELQEEQMALCVLRRWQEMPRIGTTLVQDHVETRPLYNPSKPGVEQGKLEMWVDMFPMDMPLPGPPLDISARKPTSYEMRVIIWNTDDVVLEDDAFFTGEKMSDIYVKGWLKGPDDCQSTDIHYRSLTGEGNFNWRFLFPFDYLEAEQKIVISRKESVFSWDETECKIPARLELQVWDADHFSSDDFLGALTLDLNRFPRGAKSSNQCTLEMLRNDGTVPMVNIFKQKRVKGWWPFSIKRESEDMELTGKVEAEIQLLTREEADKTPVGVGRSEPDPLDKPNRPDASFMWFLNPLKSMRYIMWHNYKCAIIKALVLAVLTLTLFLFLYAFPGYTVKRLLGA